MKTYSCKEFNPLIKKVGDVEIGYGTGEIDSWCIMLHNNKVSRYSFNVPEDVDYFTDAVELEKRHGKGVFFADFCEVYNRTTSEINQEVLTLITELSTKYGDDATLADTTLTILYAGMIAEENKQFAVLKKRIKMLGMYQLLVEGMSPSDSANFSRGKTVRQLAPLMEQRGF